MTGDTSAHATMPISCRSYNPLAPRHAVGLDGIAHERCGDSGRLEVTTHGALVRPVYRIDAEAGGPAMTQTYPGSRMRDDHRSTLTGGHVHVTESCHRPFVRHSPVSRWCSNA